MKEFNVKKEFKTKWNFLLGRILENFKEIKRNHWESSILYYGQVSEFYCIIGSEIHLVIGTRKNVKKRET